MGIFSAKWIQLKMAHPNGKGRVCTNHGKGCFFTGIVNVITTHKQQSKHQVPCSPDLALNETFWYNSLSFGK